MNTSFNYNVFSDAEPIEVLVLQPQGHTSKPLKHEPNHIPTHEFAVKDIVSLSLYLKVFKSSFFFPLWMWTE